MEERGVFTFGVLSEFGREGEELILVHLDEVVGWITLFGQFEGEGGERKSAVGDLEGLFTLHSHPINHLTQIVMPRHHPHSFQVDIDCTGSAHSSSHWDIIQVEDRFDC